MKQRHRVSKCYWNVVSAKHNKWRTIKWGMPGVPNVAQWKRIWLVSIRMWVESLSGLGIQRCHELWCRSEMQLGSRIAVAVARSAVTIPIWPPIAWKLPYTAGMTLKSKKKKKKKKRRRKKKKKKKRNFSIKQNLPFQNTNNAFQILTPLGSKNWTFTVF